MNKNELAGELVRAIKTAHISMNTRLDGESVFFSVDNKYVEQFPSHIASELAPFKTSIGSISKFTLSLENEDICQLIISFCNEAITPPRHTNNRINREDEALYSIHGVSSAVYQKRFAAPEPIINSSWIYYSKTAIAAKTPFWSAEKKAPEVKTNSNCLIM